MTNSDGRIARLELEAREFRRTASQLLARLAGVEQAGRVAQSGSMAGGGGTVPELLARGKVTTAIPTGTWAGPSSSGAARIAFRDGGGAWTEGDIVQVFNDNTMPASIPINRVVKLGLIEGQWWLLTGSCS